MNSWHAVAMFVRMSVMLVEQSLQHAAMLLTILHGTLIPARVAVHQPLALVRHHATQSQQCRWVALPTL
jgi:hypothetical protein